jgi:hypothetical protein
LEGKTEASQQKIKLIKLKSQENSGLTEFITGVLGFKGISIAILGIIFLAVILIFLIKKF